MIWLVEYECAITSDYQSLSLSVIKCLKNPVDFEWRQCKNLVFIICESSEVFRNQENSFNSFLCCCYAIVSLHSLSVMITVIKKLFSQETVRERAVHTLWPQQMVWYCATPLGSSHGEILRFTHSRVWREREMRRRRELVTPIMKPSLTRSLKHLVLLTRKSKITPPRSFENS